MSESGIAPINTSVKSSQFPARTKLLRPFSVLLPLEGLGHIEEVAHEGKLPWPGWERGITSTVAVEISGRAGDRQKSSVAERGKSYDQGVRG